ncbi:alpha/beta hydrolase [Streptomyces cadmiisoli]|uniref:alpha/beta hydrolase n=1 Tax=Streptomyces cadmiisoli TaxID=2184053 RepID=UPI003D747CA1
MSPAENAANGIWPEFQAIIDKDGASGHPGLEDLPVESARRIMASALVRWGGARNSQVVVEEMRMPAAGDLVGVRVYRPRGTTRRPTVVFFHGGGFVLGDLDTHDAVASRLAHHAGATVVSVDYTRAPEASAEAMLAQCRDIVLSLREWAERQPDWSGSLGVVGDSAGATLAWHSISSLSWVHERVIDGALLFYPPVFPECSTASWEAMASRHFLARSTMRWFWTQFFAGGCGPTWEPLRVTSNLPRVDLVVGSRDPLLDECLQLGRSIGESNATSQTLVVPGAVHGFAGMGVVSPRAEALVIDLFRAFGARLSAHVVTDR